LQQRNAHWAMRLVVGTLLLSGAPLSREVAAHSQAAFVPSRSAQATARASEPADSGPISAAPALNPAAWLSIPAGDYLPFYKGKNGAQTSPVAAFKVAAHPVTRQDFLRFVHAAPRWRRSRVERLFAEAAYLADWTGDFDPGAAPLDGPVSSVSWFAAKAYCASVGMRLPTTLEWERALSVIGPSFGEASGSNLTASLWEWTADFNSIPVAGGDSNDSVASLFCGAGARATDATDYGAFLRYSFRSSLKADFALKNLGFRCAGGA
jgi:sulfatase modifying factor 1